MIDTIRQLLETHFYTVFILGITVLAFLTLGIMLRNIKTSFVPLYFLVLLLAGFIYAIYNRYKYDGLAELILGIYLVIALIYNFVMYLITVCNSKKYYAIIKASPTVDNTILAYLNSRGKLIYYTEELLKLVTVEKPKEVKHSINYVYVEDKQLSFNGFLKTLAKPVEEDFDAVIELSNSRELKLALAKRKIIQNGNLLGYILINKKPKLNISVKEERVQTPTSINLVTEAMALYENNKFVLNKRMQSLLGVEEVANLDEYIVFEDRVQLDKRAKAEGEQSRIYYRINTKDSFIWLQETAKISNSKVTRVIKETEFKNQIYNFLDQANLINDLKQLLITQNNFTLMMLSLESLSEVKNRYGRAFSLVFATKFFGNLKDEIRDLKVYDVGYYTYAFVLKNGETYNEVIKDLHNNTSKILSSTVSFNDVSFDIKGHVGIVEARNVNNPTPEVMVELAKKTLDLAKNKKYSNDYSIYISRKKELEEELRNVDLSDDFINRLK